MVVTETDGIDERRRKAVSFFGGHDLPRSQATQKDIAKGVGRRVGRSVEQVGAEEAVLLRKLVVYSRGDKIFVDDLLCRENKWADISATVRGDRIELEVICRCGRNCYRTLARRGGWRAARRRWTGGVELHQPRASGRRRNRIQVSYAFGLPDTFVVCKEECFVFYDGSPARSSKLIASEGRALAGLEEVCRIQFVVPNEFIPASVEGICSRPRYGVDHASRSLPILSRIVAGKNGKLLNRVDPQVTAEDTSGGAVRVVVQTDAVEAVIVLLRTRSGNCELLPES